MPKEKNYRVVCSTCSKNYIYCKHLKKCDSCLNDNYQFYRGTCIDCLFNDAYNVRFDEEIEDYGEGFPDDVKHLFDIGVHHEILGKAYTKEHASKLEGYSWVIEEYFRGVDYVKKLRNITPITIDQLSKHLNETDIILEHNNKKYHIQIIDDEFIRQTEEP